MAVIELDLGRPGSTATPRPPLRVLRPAGLLLAVALLLTLAGAAPHHPVLWRELGSLPLATEDWYHLDAGRVLTVADTEDDHRVIAAWQADPPRQLWATTVPARQPADGRVIGAGPRTTMAGDLIFLQAPDYRTVAIDVATGKVRWTSERPVVPVAGIGLSRDMTYRPGSEYDQAGGDAGLLYMSEDGRPYREPPQKTDLRAVDLRTGRPLWTHTAPGAVFTAAAGPLVLVVAADRIQLLNPENGHVFAERHEPGLTDAEVVGDLVVVQQGGQSVAYDAVTLAPRWRAAAIPVGGDITGGRCDQVICRRTGAGVEVVDPATGRTAFTAGREVSLRRDGPVLLETDNVTRRPLRLLDPAGGAVLARLDGWQMVSPYGPVLLSTVEPGGKVVSFAGLRGAAIQPLGSARATVSDCGTDAGLVACRSGTALLLFAYRTG